ncbi:MAG: lysophospholipid acyltransferase family protein [Planctomycetota bacterium]|nr:lysophospholipid acyltransferase family protein [Planctomycetota bacterium]
MSKVAPEVQAPAPESDTERGASFYHSVRPGRLWARLLGPFSTFGLFWYRFHFWMARRLGGFPSWLLHSFLTTLSVVVFHRSRRAVARNLDVVLGRVAWHRRLARVYRTMWQWAWCRSERFASVITRPKEMEVEFVGREHWDRAVQGGKGAILLTAHVGNFEAANLLPDGLLSRRVHLVRDVEPDPRAQAWTEEMARQGRGPECVYHYINDSFDTGLKLFRALEDNELVVIPCDRAHPRKKEAVGRLFGRPFPVPTGWVHLARATGAQGLPTFILREGRFKYRIVFREPIEVSSAGDFATARKPAVARICQDLEWAISEKPNQWFCWTPVW